MSAEFNKVLCAILSAILVLLLSSFIGELVYHPNKSKDKVSYLIEENLPKDDVIKENYTEEKKSISSEDIELLLKQASLEDGEKFVNKNCAACHSFQLPVKNKIGPSLAIIMNREIGSLNGYKYSKALKENELKWSHKNLYLFLENPKGWAPGTKMSYRGISKQVDLLNVLKYLSNISKLNES